MTAVATPTPDDEAAVATSAGEAAYPPDWKREPLGDYVDIVSGESPSRFIFAGSGTPYFKVDQLNNSNKYAGRGQTPYFTVDSRAVPAGSVVFPKRGASIMLNKVRLFTEPGYMDTNLMALTPRRGLLSEYLYYVITYEKLSTVADTTSIPQINNKHIKPLMISLPDVGEQRAIATVLAETDELIDALDRLLVKKRALRQGAMQQLLSGRTRLHGFSDEWGLQGIGAFTDCISGGTPDTTVPRYWDGDIPWMSSGELKNKLVGDVAGRITEDGLRSSSAKVVPEKSILIGLAGQGKTRGTVAMNMIPLATNQSIAAVLPNESFVPEYLYFNLDSRYEELRGMSTGAGGRGGLNLTIIRSIEVPIPSKDEQAAIAEVLAALDEEISAHEARRAKMVAMKVGMMQRLLTGRVRLPRQEALAL